MSGWPTLDDALIVTETTDSQKQGKVKQGETSAKTGQKPVKAPRPVWERSCHGNRL